MTEESGNSSAKTGGQSGVNNANPKATSTALPGLSSSFHQINRAMTGEESLSPPTVRKRPLSWQPASVTAPESSSQRSDPLRRRSSTFSDYSLQETRRSLNDDIINPTGAGLEFGPAGQSSWGSLALAFALLPAVGGLFFEEGSAIVTDVLLLGLAAVFLHWSVRQPWVWYHSAQEVRVREETMTEMVMEDESDAEGRSQSPTGRSSTGLDDVPEEEHKADDTSKTPYPSMNSGRQRQAALNELYAHEVIALASCFLFPIMGAYLLHFLRSQLTRPSEGLVSNYNLTIFMLAAEIHPLSHLLKLVQARTLHLQRVVNSNPYTGTSPSVSQIQDMCRRLAELESRAAIPPHSPGTTPVGHGTPSEPAKPGGGSTKPDTILIREVRNAIQPELDALNRAVRRYEKKATVLAFQTESRLGAIDTRLNDAISLAAAAAKNSAQQGSFLGWLAERTVKVALMPFHAILTVAALPFKVVTGLVGRSRGGSSSEKSVRDRRVGSKGGGGGRLSSSDRDRIPTRVAKR